jgi:hypothetical protein
MQQAIHNPIFTSSNACAKLAHNTKLSCALLSSFLELDNAKKGYSASNEGTSTFYSIPIDPFIRSASKLTDTLTTIILHSTASKLTNPLDSLELIIDKFIRSADVFCPATTSVIGALAAQEVLKACGKIDTPVSQFLMFESLDSLSKDYFTTRTTINVPAYSREEVSYGYHLSKQLSALRPFVVGAGAIGCEMLKLFGLCGVGKLRENEEMSGKGHGITVTDADSIDLTNLNRQLLFR